MINKAISLLEDIKCIATISCEILLSNLILTSYEIWSQNRCGFSTIHPILRAYAGQKTKICFPLRSKSASLIANW